MLPASTTRGCAEEAPDRQTHTHWEAGWIPTAAQLPVPLAGITSEAGRCLQAGAATRGGELSGAEGLGGFL